MKHKTITIKDAAALGASVEGFSNLYKLNWIVDGRCVNEILSQIEDSINNGDEHGVIEPQAHAKNLRGGVLTMELADLQGVVLEEVELD